MESGVFEVECQSGWRGTRLCFASGSDSRFLKMWRRITNIWWTEKTNTQRSQVMEKLLLHTSVWEWEWMRGDAGGLTGMQIYFGLLLFSKSVTYNTSSSLKGILSYKDKKWISRSCCWSKHALITFWTFARERLLNEVIEWCCSMLHLMDTSSKSSPLNCLLSCTKSCLPHRKRFKVTHYKILQ